MAATKQPKARTRPRPKRKSKAERTKINRENARKSTGPRTAAGKNKSKFNACTHGMTARTVLLPGEDADALAARQQHLVDSFQPRNPHELAVIEAMAGDIWKAQRADLALGRRILLRLRHEPIEQAKLELHEAIEPRRTFVLATVVPASHQQAASPGNAHRAAVRRKRQPSPSPGAAGACALEQTVAGCDWLLDQWRDLMERLYSNQLWLPADAFKMVRLMGKHAIDMTDDITVVSVFLSSLILRSVAPKAGPALASFDWKNALIKILMTFDLENKNGTATAVAEQCEPFARRLAELPLARLAPTDEQRARATIGEIIEKQVERIHEMRRRLRDIADADAAEAPARMAFEIGPEGDRHRRYELSHERMVARRVDQFINIRIKGASGAFDPADVSLQDLLGAAPLGTAQPRAEARPVVEAAGDGDADRDSQHHDAPVFLAEVNDSGHRENDGRESQNDAPPPHIERTSLDAIPEFERVYDEPTILRNEANVSVVSCQSSVVPCEVEPFNEANVSVVGCQSSVVGSEVEAIDERESTNEPDEVRGNRPIGEMPEGGRRITDETSEIEEGQSSRPPASAEPGACAADRSLEAMIDRARMRAEFEKRTPFRAKRSPTSSELARWPAEEPGAGAGAGPISKGLENPAPRDPPAESAIDA